MGDKILFFFSFLLPYLCRLTGSGLQNSANCLGRKVKECKVYSTWLANAEGLPVRSSWHGTSGYKVLPNPRSQGPLGNRHTRKRKDPWDKAEHSETILIILDLLCDWEAVASQASDFSPRFVRRGGTPVWEARISSVLGVRFLSIMIYKREEWVGLRGRAYPSDFQCPRNNKQDQLQSHFCFPDLLVILTEDKTL